MPVFNKWLLYADLKEAEYFLIIWLITCLFDFTLLVEFPIKLTYFTSPIGLVVLGYYLRYTERKLLNNPYFDLLLIILPALIMTFISYQHSSVDFMFEFNRYSIFNSIIVIGVFLLFKNYSKFKINIHLKYLKSIFKKFASALAKYSYGIYLIHYPILFIIAKSMEIKLIP